MDHNKPTLCEKIAEGFVISFLIALLVVPCDLFQPTMWAAPVAPYKEPYVIDLSAVEEYTNEDTDTQICQDEAFLLETNLGDGGANRASAEDSEPSIINPNKASNNSNKTRKTVNTPTKPSDKSQPQSKDRDANNVNAQDSEGYIINQDPVRNLPEEFPVNADEVTPNSAIQESEIFASDDSLKVIPVDTLSIVQSPEVKLAIDSLKAVTDDSISNAFVPDSLKNIDPLKQFNLWVPREFDFNPDPTRAVWLSALFPGLGQIYNRRYWKLPIVVGAYMGLAYATSWNNTMLGDYTRAYRDIMDTDPSTNSYMDFFPPTVDEASLDKTWLKNILYSRKNYFRRYRDLCIILMVGVYLLAIVDAYVDASLAHFDISQDLSLDWSPAVFHDGFAKWPSVGVSWAFNF